MVQIPSHKLTEPTRAKPLVLPDLIRRSGGSDSPLSGLRFVIVTCDREFSGINAPSFTNDASTLVFNWS